MFARGALSFFEKHDGICVEGERIKLLVYRYHKVIKAEELREFLQEGKEILELLCK